MEYVHTFQLCIGLGAVQSLKAKVERDRISLTWTPPTAPRDFIFNYTVVYSSNSSPWSTTTTTSHQSWSIRASLGDMYSVMVTPNTNSGPGETLAITVGLDCEFQHHSNNNYAAVLLSL